MVAADCAFEHAIRAGAGLDLAEGHPGHERAGHRSADLDATTLQLADNLVRQARRQAVVHCRCGLERQLRHGDRVRDAPTAQRQERLDEQRARPDDCAGDEQRLQTWMTRRMVDHPRQRRRHLGRRGVAVRRVVGQRLVHHVDQRRGQIRAQPLQRLAPACPMLHPQGVHRAGLVQVPGGQQVEEQDADGVEVAGHRRGRAFEHFRREVHRRPDAVGVPAFEALDLDARAEIHQDHLAGPLLDDVPRLDVTMDDAGVVHRGERVADVTAHLRGFCRRVQARALSAHLPAWTRAGTPSRSPRDRSARRRQRR